jgi:Bax protein
VPRVFIDTLPKDFEFMDDNAERKDTFIKFLLPLILKVNEEISFEREQLLTITSKVKSQKILNKSELDFLYNLAEKYKTDVNNLDELSKRIDVVSVSLAIGQSVQETGWGTSYFLLDGNALFAEWTWTFDGMIPRARDENLNHRVRTFPTLIDSVRSYALILNSSKYYGQFRNARAAMRKKNAIYDGSILADTLKYYSTTPEYISLVKKIIWKNSLIDFETSVLSPDTFSKTSDLQP